MLSRRRSGIVRHLQQTLDGGGRYLDVSASSLASRHACGLAVQMASVSAMLARLVPRNITVAWRAQSSTAMPASNGVSTPRAAEPKYVSRFGSDMNTW